MFRPATELAALVRSGELSADELVSESPGADRQARAADQRVHVRGPRIGDWRPRLRSAPAIPRPFAGVPIAIKDNRAGRRACRSRCAATCSATTSPATTRSSCAGCARQGSSIVGKTALPEMGILPDDRVAPVRPDPQSVGARPHSRWLERRLGRGGRGRDGPDRPRQRRRRLDPDPRGVLRPGRAEGRRAAASRSGRTAGRASCRSTAC